VHDIAEVLGSRPPFDAVNPGELARAEVVTETEVSPLTSRRL
jgi:hypothetical protein